MVTRECENCNYLYDDSNGNVVCTNNYCDFSDKPDFQCDNYNKPDFQCHDYVPLTLDIPKKMNHIEKRLAAIQ